jgi:hypothetical protein
VTDLATLLAVNLDATERKNSEFILLRHFVQKWNQMNKEFTNKKLSLAEIELMYKEVNFTGFWIKDKYSGVEVRDA